VFRAQVKIWFQNRRSKVKKLVRHSGDVTGANDDVITDRDAEAEADEETDNKPSSDSDYHHRFSSSPPLTAVSQLHHQQQHQFSQHQSPSSWDEESSSSSFHRFPALSRLHYSYSGHSAGVNWTDSSAYGADVASRSSELAVVPRQSLFHPDTATGLQWYTTPTSPQTLLT